LNFYGKAYGFTGSFAGGYSGADKGRNPSEMQRIFGTDDGRAARNSEGASDYVCLIKLQASMERAIDETKATASNFQIEYNTEQWHIPPTTIFEIRDKIMGQT